MPKADNSQILDEIYAALYAAATPPGDWEAMKASGEVMQERFFMNYTLPEKEQTKIIDKILTKHRVKKPFRQKFHNTVVLGASPTYGKAGS